jgi:hypothetical protein
MALDLNTGSSSSTRTFTTGAARTGGGFEKAKGFVNLYMPANTPSGRVKIGFLALKESVSTERDLLAEFAADPEGFAQVLINNLIIDFRPAEDASTPSKLALKR